MSDSAHIIRGDAEPIVSDQSVRVEGNVKVSVEADGDIDVQGAVEAGAVLNGRADVIVTLGIEGDATQVAAMGRVRAGRIRESEVRAGGDVAVDGAVERARIRAGAGLQVAGPIVGGEVWAATRLQATDLGNATGERTVVGIATGLEIEARLAKVREGLDFCKADILRIFRTLEIQTVSKAVIAALLDRTPAAKRKFVLEILKKLDGLVQLRKKLLAKEAALLAASDRQLREATIEVVGKVYAGVQIRFGEEMLDITQDLENPSFTLSDGGIVLRD